MKSQWMIVCGLVFAFLTAIVAVSNISNVTLDYLFGEVEVSLILVISASVLIGGIIVAFFGMRQPQLHKKEVSMQKKQIQQLEADNQRLHAELEQTKNNFAALKQEHQKLLSHETHEAAATVEPPES